MKPAPAQGTFTLKFVLYFALLFLLFFQLVSDFIESVYTFGLLGTDIPPEMASIVVFFAPLLLLFLRRKPPLRAALVLTTAAAALRAVELAASPAGKMLAAGVGVGVLLLVFPILLAHLRPAGEPGVLSLSASLIVGLALSILLRTLGAGSDISLLFPALGWLLCALLLLVTWLILQVEIHPQEEEAPAYSSFWRATVLSIGFLGALLVLYFAFTSPGVMARWSEIDYRLLLLALGITLSVFFAWLAEGQLQWMTKSRLVLWNILFIAAGAGGIFIHQTRFPAESTAYPVYQTVASPWMQIPLFLFILLSPVVMIDFHLLAGELTLRRPSMRQMAGGFTLASLLFLLIVLGQVFTSVYDYIPVVGPWFRDRFWLVFLLAGLSLTLPLLAVRKAKFTPPPGALRVIYLPVIMACMLAAIVAAVLQEPLPSIPASSGGLRVLTYNIQQGYDQTGSPAYLDQLAVIKAQLPDIVGLQETDVARFTGGNADLVRTLANGLNMYAYYGPKTVNGTFGIALLSRYPLENPQTFYMYSTGEQTAAITADVKVNEKTWHILVTHLGNDGPMIQQQQVLSVLEGKENVILMGDFNFNQTSEQYALTLQSLESAWTAAEEADADGLEVAKMIDHVFVSPGVKVLAVDTIVAPVSDHPGLLVEIAP